ncbi:thioesterase-like superfamily-domain-containing protein [Scheffersomyces amazonensis]|uniref:thioesterase-like superfamily-domain-containing protein n=1 Tax=Scheffersomyces amazonensis TaxID=1078765 RepID=UPI00315CE54A
MSAALSTNNIKRGRMDFAFEVKTIINPETKEVEYYEGIKPLNKPTPTARGVYGGNLCGQALIVALESVPANSGLVPHSLHSYFVKAGDDKIPCQYKVEKLSDGRNFANRLIRVFQNDELKYIIMVSLTKKNSMDKARKDYHQNNDTVKKPPLPIEFQKEVDSTFYKYSLNDLPTQFSYDTSGVLEYKFPPNYIDPKFNENEHLLQPGDRSLSFWIRVNDNTPGKSSTAAKFAGFGVLSDSVYLSSLGRILHLPNYNNGLPLGALGTEEVHFFSLSLDHSIYFHDEYFEPKDWIYVTFSAPKLSNNRALLTAHYYDQTGRLFATIVQEGLVFFRNGSEYKAKL